MPVSEVTGIHEVQVGELENRSDDDAVAEFDAIYQRWHEGERDVPMPGGETPTRSWTATAGGDRSTDALSRRP